MWTCRKCSTRADAAPKSCPGCGAATSEVTMPDESALRGTLRGDDDPTEYDVHDLPDPGLAVVECYIGVTESEASTVASRLRDLGIPVLVGRDDSGEGPLHRVRVPIVDLSRALAVIDLLHRRRVTRH